MTNVSGISGLGGGANTASTHPALVQPVGPSDASAKQAVTISSISPRLVVDPVVGVITQYLDSNGKVDSQNPSTTVVAYLKAGLTTDGFSQATPSAKTA